MPIAQKEARFRRRAETLPLAYFGHVKVTTIYHRPPPRWGGGAGKYHMRHIPWFFWPPKEEASITGTNTARLRKSSLTMTRVGGRY